jgi:hypothetical protein
MNLLDQLLGRFGVAVERRLPPRVDITAVESAVQVGRIFDANCERQKIDHDIAMRGGARRIASNAGGLGHHRGLIRTITDWLQ